MDGKQDLSANRTHQAILRWLAGLKFKRRLFGGVDEEDVLRKMEELNALYESALIEERARCDALLAAKGGENGDRDDRKRGRAEPGGGRDGSDGG